MPLPKRMFITGATGYVGGSIAQRLVKNGVQVRGLARSEVKAAWLSAHGIEPVFGTLDDAELLEAEAQKSEGVVSAASADHSASVQALIKGLAGSFKPLLHTSGSSLVGDDVRGSQRSDTIFDEATPLVVSALKQPRRAIDLEVLAAANRGVRAVVICPGLIYGQGQGFNPHSVQIPCLAANALQQGVVQIVGAGLNTWSHVHLDDVVDLYWLALTNAPPGAFYFAENGEAAFLQIGTALAKRLGLKGVESLDPEVAASLWGIARAYYSFGSNSRVRAVRARQTLAWQPRYRSVIDWILDEMPIRKIDV